MNPDTLDAAMDQVSRDYEAGLWVPAYHGLRYTVAKKQPSGVRASEIDPAFRSNTFAGAQDEARARNLKASMERVSYSLFWDDCVTPPGWRIFRVGFSGRSVVDPRTWGKAERSAAETALAEFIAKLEAK